LDESLTGHGLATIAIDAAALDRPVVCAGFDGRRTLPYEQSVAD